MWHAGVSGGRKLPAVISISHVCNVCVCVHQHGRRLVGRVALTKPHSRARNEFETSRKRAKTWASELYFRGRAKQHQLAGHWTWAQEVSIGYLDVGALVQRLTGPFLGGAGSRERSLKHMQCILGQATARLAGQMAAARHIHPAWCGRRSCRVGNHGSSSSGQPTLMPTFGYHPHPDAGAQPRVGLELIPTSSLAMPWQRKSRGRGRGRLRAWWIAKSVACTATPPPGGLAVCSRPVIGWSSKWLSTEH